MINKIFEDDQTFDWLFPEHFQLISKKQWTPISIAQQSAGFLALPGSKVLDIGSGIGKFCLIAARQHPATMFFGVEQRPELVHHANVAMEFLRLDNLEFIHANMTQINFKAFDHFYFYNSFFENVDFIGRIDDSVETSLALYKYYTQYLSANLDRMPQGTRLVSFQGSGKEVPENFTLVKSTFNGLLNMYVKST